MLSTNATRNQCIYGIVAESANIDVSRGDVAVVVKPQTGDKRQDWGRKYVAVESDREAF